MSPSKEKSVMPPERARPHLDREALQEAASGVTAMLGGEGLSDAELDEVSEDFCAWRKTFRQ